MNSCHAVFCSTLDTHAVVYMVIRIQYEYSLVFTGFKTLCYSSVYFSVYCSVHCSVYCVSYILI